MSFPEPFVRGRCTIVGIDAHSHISGIQTIPWGLCKQSSASPHLGFTDTSHFDHLRLHRTDSLDATPITRNDIAINASEVHSCLAGLLCVDRWHTLVLENTVSIDCDKDDQQGLKQMATNPARNGLFEQRQIRLQVRAGNVPMYAYTSGHHCDFAIMDVSQLGTNFGIPRKQQHY
jgi:hypothetical protein